MAAITLYYLKVLKQGRNLVKSVNGKQTLSRRQVPLTLFLACCIIVLF